MTDRERARVLLGVNIDHVATVRQARGTTYPDLLEAASLARSGGADYITFHLREDRRHIQDEDARRLCQMPGVRMNMEMAATTEMLRIACALKPEDVCLVPEKRQELTTEGGLDVAGQLAAITGICGELRSEGIRPALFIDPEPDQIRAAAAAGVQVVELHTGRYAELRESSAVEVELSRLRRAVVQGQGLGLQVNAGHGLTVENVASVAAIPGVAELNIGHAIIARAVMVGLVESVREMKVAMQVEAIPQP
ncbi:MAG: pyridoxine 5'-phosphate synthase [Gammaproteobacteria bacterium]|nr:pyridoxine 5'-phosphate synthase [Gammaproteobacteria bacterium]